MATELAKAYVQIVPSAQGISGSLSDVLNGEAKSAGNSAGQISGKSIFNSLKGTIAKLGIAKMVADAITGSADFEEGMAKVSTLFEGTTEEFNDLQDGILGISSSMGIATGTLTEAAYSAESAGVAQADLMTMLEGSAKLAVAGFTDIDTALSATAKTMNAYGMTGEEAMNKVQKVLIQTQNKGITTVGELGASLAQVTPTAAAFGVSFENVGAALAVMTAQGTPTAQATTQLNSVIAELGKKGTTAAKNLAKATKGTKYAKKSFAELMNEGVDLGEVLSLMQGYADKTGVSMVDLFSSIEAGKAAMAISSDIEGFNADMEAMSTNADVVGEAYGKMANTMNNALARIKESFKNLGTALFTGGDISASIETLTSSIQELLQDNLVPMITGALSGLGDALPAIAEGLLAIVDGLWEALKGVDWGAVGNAILNGIVGVIDVAGKWLGDLLSKAVSFVTGSECNIDFGNIGTTIKNGVMSVIDAAGAWLADLFGIGVSAVADGGGVDFASIGSAILGGVTSIITTTGDWLKNLFTTGVSAVTEGGGVDFSSIGDSILGGVTSIITATGGWLKDIFTTAKESAAQDVTWGDIGQSIMNGVNGVLEAGTAGTHFIAEVFEGGAAMAQAINWGAIGGAISDGVTGFIDAEGKFLQTAFQAGCNLVQGIDWGKIGKAISDGVAGLIDAGGKFLQTAFQAGCDLVQGIDWGKIGTAISDKTVATLKVGEAASDVLYAAFSASKDLITGIPWADIGNAISNGVGTVLTDIWEGAKDIASGVGGAASDIWNGAKTGVSDIWGAIFGKNNGGSEEGKEQGRALATGISEGLSEGKSTALQTAETFITEVVTKISDKIKSESWQDRGQDIASGIEAGLNEGYAGSIGPKIAEQIEAIKAEYTSQDWKKIGTDLSDGIKNGIAERKQMLSSEASQAMEAVKTVFTSADWRKTGRDLMDEIKNGMAGKKTALSTEAGQGAKAIQEKFKAVDWKELGKNIVQGIAKGITSNLQIIREAAEKAAEEALKAAKQKLGIASPSKVMRDEVGFWISEGIAEGIRRNAESVSLAMSDIASNVSRADIAGELNAQGNRFRMAEYETAAEREGGVTQNINIYSPEALSPYEIARQVRLQNQNLILAIKR